MRKMDEEIYRTIHRPGRFKKIAEENSIKESTLYRYGLPIENNGLNIPLAKLAGIMKSAAYYGILHFIAAQCRRIVVPVPRAPRNKLDESEMVQHYQRSCNTAISQLIDFFKSPSKTRYDSASKALTDVASESFSIQKSLRNTDQLEFSF